MSTILCVDDDAYLTDLLRHALTRDGHTVLVASRGTEALRLVQSDRPDLVLLDRTLPDLDGLELCRQIRARFPSRVILMSPHGADEEVLAGFDHGADDYITKPFNLQILTYRVRAILRRTRPAATAPPRQSTSYRMGAATFDVEHNVLRTEHAEVRLTRIEARILHLLVTHAGQMLPATRIFERLWDYNAESDVSVVKTHIRHLRIKLAEATGDADLIKTVPGVGYTLRPDRVRQGQALVAS